MKRVLGCLGIVVVILLLLGGTFAGGIVLDREVLAKYVPPNTDPAETTIDFQLISEAWNRINESYVDRSAIQGQALTYGAVSGMVDALGDTGHSRFLSPEMLREQHDFTSGQVEGIGAYMEIKDGHVTIASPMDGSPAQKAGLLPGDIVLKVDGESVTGMPIDQVVGRITGPAGTSVTLTILTPDTQQTRDVTLVRAHITLENVTWKQVPGTEIAHVRIAAFSQGVTDDLKQALTEIHDAGLTGIVLDLRSNPGGLLGEAVDTASQFLVSGNVLLEKDAQGKTTPVAVVKGGLAPDLPLVVLIDAGTGSAAEIVAGALQDANRAQLVGETTFGTGTVLNEFSLSDGSALLLATEEWLTPKGRTIWHQGIAPDVEVTLAQGTSPLLPEAEGAMTAEQVQNSGDAQLLRALELLGQPAAGQASAP
jgi:carboxyl-terminal processing protease